MGNQVSQSCEPLEFRGVATDLGINHFHPSQERPKLVAILGIKFMSHPVFDVIEGCQKA
jgi:hypothetical protein